MMSSSFGDIPGLRCTGRAGVSSKIALKTTADVLPETLPSRSPSHKARRPVKRCLSGHPAFRLAPVPATCTLHPSAAPGLVSTAGLVSALASNTSASSSNLASPKSRTLHSPCAVTKMLPGFKSRERFRAGGRSPVHRPLQSRSVMSAPSAVSSAQPIGERLPFQKLHD